MGGRGELAAQLARLQPVRRPGTYVFAVVGEAGALPPDDVVALVREEEGVTVVVRQEAADRHGLGYDFVAVWITLDVHSALTSVGLTAAVSRMLADAGISVNVLAGTYHDHLLVPVGRAEEAMRILGRPPATRDGGRGRPR